MSNFTLCQLVQALDTPEVYRIESIRETAANGGLSVTDYLLKAIENAEPHNDFILSGSWLTARDLRKVGKAPAFSLGDTITGFTIIEITLSPKRGWEYRMQDDKADSFVLNEDQLNDRFWRG